MAVMGLISRIRGRKTALTNQADTSSAVAYLQGVYGETLGTLDYLIEVEGVEMSHDQKMSVLRPLDFAIAQQELAQRLAETEATTEVQKNATRKERQNHGE